MYGLVIESLKQFAGNITVNQLNKKNMVSLHAPTQMHRTIPNSLSTDILNIEEIMYPLVVTRLI